MHQGLLQSAERLVLQTMVINQRKKQMVASWINKPSSKHLMEKFTEKEKQKIHESQEVVVMS